MVSILFLNNFSKFSHSKTTLKLITKLSSLHACQMLITLMFPTPIESIHVKYSKCQLYSIFYFQKSISIVIFNAFEMEIGKISFNHCCGNGYSSTSLNSTTTTKNKNQTFTRFHARDWWNIILNGWSTYAKPTELFDRSFHDK